MLALQALTPDALGRAFGLRTGRGAQGGRRRAPGRAGRAARGVRRVGARRRRGRRATCPRSRCGAVRRSALDPFVKLALATADGHVIEAVRIPLERAGRFSACVSSQAGLRAGLRVLRHRPPRPRAQPGDAGRSSSRCASCAARSARDAARARRRLPGDGRAAVERRTGLDAIRVMSDPCALAIDARAITVCTSGSARAASAGSHASSRRCGSASPSAARAPRSAGASCPSPSPTRSTRSSTPPRSTRASPASRPCGRSRRCRASTTRDEDARALADLVRPLHDPHRRPPAPQRRAVQRHRRRRARSRSRAATCRVPRPPRRPRRARPPSLQRRLRRRRGVRAARRPELRAARKNSRSVGKHRYLRSLEDAGPGGLRRRRRRRCRGARRALRPHRECLARGHLRVGRALGGHGGDRCGVGFELGRHLRQPRAAVARPPERADHRLHRRDVRPARGRRGVARQGVGRAREGLRHRRRGPHPVRRHPQGPHRRRHGRLHAHRRAVARGRSSTPRRPRYPLLAERSQVLAVRLGAGADIGWGLRVGAGLGVLRLARATSPWPPSPDRSARTSTPSSRHLRPHLRRVVGPAAGTGTRTGRRAGASGPRGAGRSTRRSP